MTKNSVSTLECIVGAEVTSVLMYIQVTRQLLVEAVHSTHCVKDSF